MKCHFPAVQTISMLEIRKNAKGLVERLRRGESFMLTYRNQAVGELRPCPGEPEDFAGDPIYDVADQAEDLDGGMDTRKADALIYES